MAKPKKQKLPAHTYIAEKASATAESETAASETATSATAAQPAEADIDFDPSEFAQEPPPVPEPVRQVVTEPAQSPAPPAPQSELKPQSEMKPSPDPYAIAGDYAAGVRLLESRRRREMQIRFDEKPGPETIEKVKAGGFRWNPGEKAWTHRVTQDSGPTVRVEAEKLFQEVSGSLRKERGIDSGHAARVEADRQQGGQEAEIW